MTLHDIKETKHYRGTDGQTYGRSHTRTVRCENGNRTFKHERNRKFDFISLMNTKSGIFTRGFTTRENTAFGVHSMK